MNGEVIVVDDVPGEFSERVVEAFLNRPGDGFSLVLSGGSTARRCYERLAADGADQIDWWQVDVYWGDERCVPPDHPESNERLGREALLERVGAANAVYPMRCEDGPDPYQQRIAAAGRLDLVHLGLGPDGHTASLFPGHPMATAEGVAVAVHDSPKPPPDRVSLTLAKLNESRRIVLLVTGADKAPMLARVIAGPDPAVPASLLDRDKLEIIADTAALGE